MGSEISYRGQEHIITQITLGDEQAFRSFYEQFAPKIFRTAKRYLQNDNVAQDIVQEVFSTIWMRRDTLSEILNIEFYLIAIARNATYRELSKWADEVRFREEYTHALEMSSNSSESDLISQQYDALLSNAVNQLPAQQRKVFELGKYEGLTHEAIAEQMNLSQGTVKNHMVRALRFLREQLAPHISTILLFWISK